LAIEHETGRIVDSVDVDYRSKLFVRITLDSPNPHTDMRTVIGDSRLEYSSRLINSVAGCSLTLVARMAEPSFIQAPERRRTLAGRGRRRDETAERYRPLI